MPSSTSSSDHADARSWRRYVRTLLASAAGLGLGLYLFVVVVDPWGVLPLSPPLPRVPISTNARFSFPALARSEKFDGAIFGTSTSRLLRPPVIDAALGTHVANLAMNSATPYEQTALLMLFLRHHPAARLVIIGLDGGWCAEAPDRLTPRAFPAWMYQGSPWRGYLEMFDLFGVQEAAKQFAVMIGLKRPPYGADGYTRFVPDEAEYDLARARNHIAEEQASAAPDDPSQPIRFPAHALLATALSQMSGGTRVVLAFMPVHVVLQGAPGTRAAADLAACKRQVSELAATRRNVAVVDFMRPTSITIADGNYWDPHHYRVGIADRIAADLAAVASGRPLPAEDGLLLAGRE